MNPWTAKVELMLTLYNAHMDTFSAVYVVFFVNRAGNFHRMVQPITFWMNPYHDAGNYLADFVWIALVLKIMFNEVVTLQRFVQKNGSVYAGFCAYFGIQAVSDWINVLYAFVVVALWIVHLNHLSVLQDYLELANVEV